MPLAEDFDRAALRSVEGQPSAKRAGNTTRKRPPPFTIRLTADERARLATDAAGLPLATYIKATLFNANPPRIRRTGLSIADRKAHAQALAILGRSHLASNLNLLAHAVNIGVLPVTPETEAALYEAVCDVREIRRLLMTALGVKPEGGP